MEASPRRAPFCGFPSLPGVWAVSIPTQGSPGHASAPRPCEQRTGCRVGRPGTWSRVPAGQVGVRCGEATVRWAGAPRSRRQLGLQISTPALCAELVHGWKGLGGCAPAQSSGFGGLSAHASSEASGFLVRRKLGPGGWRHVVGQTHLRGLTAAVNSPTCSLPPDPELEGSVWPVFPGPRGPSPENRGLRPPEAPDGPGARVAQAPQQLTLLAPPHRPDPGRAQRSWPQSGWL